jgi:integrase
MTVPDGGTPASAAVEAFTRHLAGRFSDTTCRIRRRYLEEYLAHARAGTGTGGPGLTVAELMTPERAEAWLADAGAGKLRTRNTRYGPDAAATPNSMRVRIDSWNAFAQFLGWPDRLTTPPPVAGFHLTPSDTEGLLHDLSARRPIGSNFATSVRTAAMAALVADTGRGVPELAALKVGALHLDGEPHVDLGEDDPCPLSEAAAQILTRWLNVRAEIVEELQGSDPGHLWVPTKPGRPRGGQPPVKPGLNQAAVRTLHAAHRTLVSQVLGAPLRPGAFREYGTAFAAAVSAAGAAGDARQGAEAGPGEQVHPH